MEEWMEWINDLKYEMDLYEDYISQAFIQKTEMLWQLIKDTPDETKRAVAKELILIGQEDHDKHVYMKVWLYSVAIYLTNDYEILADFIRFLMQTDKLKMNTLYFLYWHISIWIFREKKLVSYQTKRLVWRFLEYIYAKFKDEIGMDLHRLELAEQDSETALVITTQFLAVQHGPTKTALDRCYTLMHRMGKKVMLLNTVEFCSNVGEIPLWDKAFGNYIPELKDCFYQTWKGCKISYVQCEQNMPDLETMRVLLNSIYELKPSIIIVIGGSSIFGGLANEIVPTLTVGTTPSAVSSAISDYQILQQGKLSQEEYSFLKEIGKDEMYGIPGRFTFSLKEQSEYLTRQLLGLPEDVFLLCTIGARLAEEVSEDFILMLQKVLSEKIQMVFIGCMSTYEELCSKYSYLQKYSFCLGFVDDILSRVELCDLYINPVRRGGGTSCVEAMYKGLPVITTAYGDVSAIVGSEFICNDYDEMAELIKVYAEDTNFYEARSKLAREKAAENMDTEVEFERCVNIYLERKTKKLQ